MAASWCSPPPTPWVSGGKFSSAGRSVGPLLHGARAVAGVQEDAAARQLRLEMPGRPHGEWTPGPKLLRGRAREGVVVPALLPGSKALDERKRHPESHQ